MGYITTYVKTAFLLFGQLLKYWATFFKKWATFDKLGNFFYYLITLVRLTDFRHTAVALHLRP